MNCFVSGVGVGVEVEVRVREKSVKFRRGNKVDVPSRITTKSVGPPEHHPCGRHGLHPRLDAHHDGGRPGSIITGMEARV